MRFLFLLFLLISPIFAIVDVATEDFDENLDGFSGNVYGSFQYKRGNTVKDEVEFGGRLQYNTSGTVTWVQAEIEKDTSQEISTDDNAFIHIRHIHEMYNQDWAMEYYGQIKTDKFKNVKQRTLLGLGSRYRMMNSLSYGKAFLGASVLSEVVNYTESEIDPNENNYRVNSYFSYQVPINKAFDLTWVSNFQPKVSRLSDYMAASNLELTMHLTKVFDLSYLIEFDYDSKPPSNVFRHDLVQKLSFVYRFGKDDPFSAYAQNFLRSTDLLKDVNGSESIAVQLNTKLEDIEDPMDTFAGEWKSGEESFSISLDGKGKYISGVYSEKLSWKVISTETQEGVQGAKNQSTKLVIIRFEDEEGRAGRVENYLWSNNTLVGLSGSSIRQFSR